MISKRTILLCIVLAALAAALQAISVIWGSAFVFAVIPSGLPVYIATRLNYIPGLVLYFSVAILSAYINMSEALFFVCVSGIIGLTLGMIKDLFRCIYLIPIPSALIVFAMLSAVNYFFGISIFDNASPRTLIQQALAFIPLLYAYSFIYLKIYMLAENFLQRNLELGSY